MVLFGGIVMMGIYFIWNSYLELPSTISFNHIKHHISIFSGKLQANVIHDIYSPAISESIGKYARSYSHTGEDRLAFSFSLVIVVLCYLISKIPTAAMYHYAQYARFILCSSLNDYLPKYLFDNFFYLR